MRDSQQEEAALRRRGSTPSHAVLGAPLPVDLGSARPGQAVSASVLVWRSDGEAVGHFLVSPPAGAPEGFALYPHRQDAHHCQVDVMWQAPAAGGEPGGLETAFEVAVDGSALTVPVRMRLAPPKAARRVAWRRPPVGVLAIAVSCAVLGVAAARWGADRNAAGRAAVFGAKRSETRLDGLDAPPAPPVARPLPRVTSVRTWRGIALWRVEQRAVSGPARTTMVVDTRRRPVRPGDALVAWSTRAGTLPAALVFDGIHFSRDTERLALRRGAVERVEVRRESQKSPPVFTAADQRRRDDLLRIAAFLQSESARAGALPKGVPSTQALRRYRQTFQAEVPFRGDFRIWNMRLIERWANRGGGAGSHLTAGQLRAFALQVRQARAAIRPTAPPPREVTRTVRTMRPVKGALLLASGNGEAAAGDVLRPVGPGDSGLFYVLRLSRPLTVQGNPFPLLLSPQPFQPPPSRSLPRYVVRPEGVLRLETGELPAAGARAPALLIPGASVPVSLLDSAQVQAAG